MGLESFDDYLDLLDTRRWTIDMGTQVPHAAVRFYVMGWATAQRTPMRATTISAG